MLSFSLKSASSLMPREPVPDSATTSVSFHSMERPKTLPQGAPEHQLDQSSVKTMLAPPDAAAIKSSHLIASMGPVPESAEIFNEALHHAVDAETPASMVNDMNGKRPTVGQIISLTKTVQ